MIDPILLSSYQSIRWHWSPTRDDQNQDRVLVGEEPDLTCPKRMRVLLHPTTDKTIQNKGVCAGPPKEISNKR